LNEYSAEIWKKTSFFTNGNHVDLFLDLNQHLEDMDIHTSVSDSVFKVKFDATPSQAQKVFKFYAQKINALPADIQTAAQKAILEKPETKAILEGKKEIEESKDEAKATCIIELLGVRKIEKAENDEESKETEEDNQSKVACCVDFSYRDKTAKKLDCEKHFVSHFKAWKALLNPWVNMSSSEI